MDLHVHTVISSMRMSGRRIEEVRSATQADPQIKALMNVMQYGWPECREKCQSHALEFLETIEVIEIDGLIFKGRKRLIPRDLRHQIIKLFTLVI